MRRYFYKFIIYIFIIMFLLNNRVALNADYNMPKTVKIGLSFGASAADNFSIKSSSGFSIENGNGEIIITDYNNSFIVKKEAADGSYHIQIGEAYNSIEEARAFYNALLPVINDLFMTYEDGWSICTGSYSDENQCLKQIEVLEAKTKDYQYKVIRGDRKRICLTGSSSDKALYVINAENDIYVKPLDNSTQYIEYNNKKYRGSFILKRIQGSDITVINELGIEQYLYSVVPSESVSSWPIESLKAQAVASRNYAVLNIGKHSKYGFDLCNGQDCQTYKGVSQETPKTNDAVDQTKEKLVFYNDKLINAVYHSSSGGHTENSENIWGFKMPYLTGVDDSFGLGSKYDNWIKTFDKEYIKQKMIESKMDVGEILDIVPIEISPNGRVIQVEIRGTKDTQPLKKEKIRYILGTMELKSIWYDLKTDADVSVYNNKSISETKRLSGSYVVSDSGLKLVSGNSAVYVKGETSTNRYSTVPNEYIFNGKGFGHGVGMSQYGAKGMADAGYNYIQILQHYYKDSTVQ